MRRTMPKDLVREMELDSVEEAKMELRIEGAWAAYAGKLVAKTVKLAG